MCRRRAREPRLNQIVAEIQLYLGEGIHDVSAVHFWSEDNAVCDALSRLGEGAALPQELRNAVHDPPRLPVHWRLLPVGEYEQVLAKSR